MQQALLDSTRIKLEESTRWLIGRLCVECRETVPVSGEEVESQDISQQVYRGGEAINKKEHAQSTVLPQLHKLRIDIERVAQKVNAKVPQVKTVLKQHVQLLQSVVDWTGPRTDGTRLSVKDAYHK
jgi:hypothetical protein